MSGKAQDLKTKLLRRVERVPFSECWYWVGANVPPSGYGVLCNGRRGHQIYAHRAAWMVFHGPIPEGMFVLHKCDVPSCVNPDHLFTGTAKENTHDMMAKGRMAINNAKLTEDKVREIRIDGRKQRTIAAEYGVSASVICNIKSGRTWKHV